MLEDLSTFKFHELEQESCDSSTDVEVPKTSDEQTKICEKEEPEKAFPPSPRISRLKIAENEHLTVPDSAPDSLSSAADVSTERSDG